MLLWGVLDEMRCSYVGKGGKHNTWDSYCVLPFLCHCLLMYQLFLNWNIFVCFCVFFPVRCGNSLPHLLSKTMPNRARSISLWKGVRGFTQKIYEFNSPLHYLAGLGRSRRRLQRHSFNVCVKNEQSHPPKETEKPRVKPRKYNSREQRQAHLNGTSRSYFRQFYCSHWKHGTARDGERGGTRLRRSLNCARFNPEDIFLFGLLKPLC